MDRPTDWVNSLVIARKKDGKRLCLDTRHLNVNTTGSQQLKTLPQSWLVKVCSLYSVKRMGFGTHPFWGKRVPFVTSTPLLDDLFLRCPVGISSVLEVFQKRNDQLFGDIAVVYVVFDDVIIGEKDDTEHDSIQFRILLVRVMLTLLSSSS